MIKGKLISYAVSFISFLLEEKISEDINRIILFGSVVKGDFDEESDIDIFIDTQKNIEREIEKIKELFFNSEINKKWILKGIKNEISIKTGELDKWKLKRDIITDGIMLYGKFKEIPEKTEYYILVVPSFRKFSRSNKVRIWRKLYGYKQTTKRKTYETKGVVSKLNGKRIENGIIVLIKNKKELIDFLNKEKVNYTVNEIWSDTF